MGPHISLSAEKIGSLFGLPITNSLLTTWVVMAILFILTYFFTRSIQLIPGNLQQVAEMILDMLYGLFASVVGKDKIKQFFPLLASIFLFVMISNWSGLLPGVGSIKITPKSSNSSEHALVTQVAAVEQIVTTGLKPELTSDEVRGVSNTGEHKAVPLFRGPTADLNTTLALALVAVFSLQYFGFKSLGLGYLKKFINFANPIDFFLGILELISELAKVISFAFRLFGNIFAGEVLLTVIAFLMPVIAPLPFIGLELFVGVIQALVFSMLTAVFLNMATTAHGHEAAH
ncbi:TPA: ATP synthase F0 subunit A [Patescibacteria group bacterium]|uniref:ATP synthase subunit a n=1 Tax=Candidatus Gottesmanbacteria bacterium GW2011_GWA1_43_11 TaxID=1618436 RepID=A0A0G1CG48_9BACT|nr:MAG: ATP synthase subunit a [Candidatus Gottesmanbacteria bacterium GW2011_GWA1_43_11]HCS79508.1 ATP synthase F0 subunit A [Patescibacteria group bacterium]